MKLSARNVLKGRIVEIKKGATTAHVRIDIGGASLTSSITNEAVDELKLASGQAAYAVIKSSSVMVATATGKLSARNVLAGRIVEVKKGVTTSHVRIDVGGSVITSSITNEAVEDLKLASGQNASAVIKSSDVLVAID
jgi:molybdate transport system regulatory protein